MPVVNREHIPSYEMCVKSSQSDPAVWKGRGREEPSVFIEEHHCVLVICSMYQITPILSILEQRAVMLSTQVLRVRSESGLAGWACPSVCCESVVT